MTTPNELAALVDLTLMRRKEMCSPKDLYQDCNHVSSVLPETNHDDWEHIDPPKFNPDALAGYHPAQSIEERMKRTGSYSPRDTQDNPSDNPITYRVPTWMLRGKYGR